MKEDDENCGLSYVQSYKEKYGERPMKEVLKELEIQHARAERAYNDVSQKETDAIRAIEKAKQKEYDDQNGVKTAMGHLHNEGYTYLCLPEKERMITEFVYSDRVRMRGGKMVIHREHILTGWKTPVREKSPEEKRNEDKVSALWREICDMRIWA
jgi:hypothetical protein